MNQPASLEAILDTAPIETDAVGVEDAPRAAVGIQHLLGLHEILYALWSLKSFYRSAGVRYPLTLHCQGDFSPADLARLAQHFPNARIVLQEEADARVEPWLAEHEWSCLQTARREDFLVQRITDFYFFSHTINVLSFDSDVLFFRRPRELLIGDSIPLQKQYFQRDCYDSYVLSVHRAIRELGIFLVPRLNCGITLQARDALHPARYEPLLEHPALGKSHWHREQTLRALAASADKRARYLPASYVLATDTLADAEEWTARHYVSPIRERFVSEGLERIASQF